VAFAQPAADRTRETSQLKSAAPEGTAHISTSLQAGPPRWARVGCRSRFCTADQKLERWLRTVRARGARRPESASARFAEPISKSSHESSTSRPQRYALYVPNWGNCGMFRTPAAKSKTNTTHRLNGAPNVMPGWPGPTKRRARALRAPLGPQRLDAPLVTDAVEVERTSSQKLLASCLSDVPVRH
jgi:hypothetical protein